MFLLFLTLLDVIYAYSLAYPTPRSLVTPTYTFLAHVAPLQVWASLWAVIGIITGTFAFRLNDAVGYAAAMFLKILWGGTFLLGWLVGSVERGYLSAAIWLSFAAVVGLISSWPEARHRP